MNLPHYCRIGIVAVFVTCSVLTGCEPTDNLSRASLTGTVTYQGKALDHGRVSLIPTGETQGPQGIGLINADGTYEISTVDKPGAIIGTHKVIVQCYEKLSTEEANSMGRKKLLIPRKYANVQNTPLTIEIPSEGTTFDIKLVD